MMNPFEIGDYTVIWTTSVRGDLFSVLGPEIRGEASLRHFRTRPMALRYAAKRAGRQRQWIRLNPANREVETGIGGHVSSSVRLAFGESFHSETMQYHLGWLAERAHEYATAHYGAGESR